MVSFLVENAKNCYADTYLSQLVDARCLNGDGTWNMINETWHYNECDDDTCTWRCGGDRPPLKDHMFQDQLCMR